MYLFIKEVVRNFGGSPLQPLLVALAKKIQGQVITREETAEHVSAKDFLPRPPLSKQQTESTSQPEQIIKPEVLASSEMAGVADLLFPNTQSQQDIVAAEATTLAPIEQLNKKETDHASLTESTTYIPNPSAGYASTRSNLSEIIRLLPTSSPFKQYG